MPRIHQLTKRSPGLKTLLKFRRLHFSYLKVEPCGLYDRIIYGEERSKVKNDRQRDSPSESTNIKQGPSLDLWHSNCKTSNHGPLINLFFEDPYPGTTAVISESDSKARL
jgi:hypothetical protein